MSRAIEAGLAPITNDSPLVWVTIYLTNHDFSPRGNRAGGECGRRIFCGIQRSDSLEFLTLNDIMDVDDLRRSRKLNA